MRTVALRGPMPAIRVRAAPTCEPPYDDEHPGDSWLPGQLMLDWSRRPEPDQPPPPVVTGATAEARTAVRRFVGVLVEVLNGYRAPSHLRQLCRPVEAAAVIAQARAAQHRIAQARLRRPRVCRDRHGRRPDPVAVIRMRLCEPRAGAVEATVLLATGVRTWALALRIEDGPQGWAATVARVL